MIIKPFGFFRLKRGYMPCFYDPMFISWSMQEFSEKPAAQGQDNARKIQEITGGPGGSTCDEAFSPFTG
jgi:hypothetical protein